MDIFLFFFLSYFSIAISKSISSRNYEQIINNTDGFPVFVEVWDRWCPHCQKFSKIWEEISNETRYSQRVIFADIECGNEKRSNKACQMFKGDQTPRLYWLEKDELIKPYAGIIIKSEIEKFINNQFDNVIKNVSTLFEGINEKNSSEFASLNERELIKGKFAEKSVFLFNISADDSKSISTAFLACKRKNNLDLEVFIEYRTNSTISEPNLLYFSESGNIISFKDYISDLYFAKDNEIHSFSDQYKKSFTVENISTFLEIHSMPYMVDFMPVVSNFVDQLKINLVIFMLRKEDQSNNNNNNKLLNEKLLRISKQIEYLVPTAKANCQKWNYPCRYFGIKSDEIIYWDKKNRKHYLFSEYLKQYLFLNKNSDLDEGEKAIEWIHKIENNEIEGRGPGESELKNIFFEMRGNGGIRYYILFLPISIIVLLVSVLMYVEVDSILEERKSKKE